MIGSRANVPAQYAEDAQYAVPYPMGEEESASGGFTLVQIWCMLRAHLWLSIGIFVVMVALAFVAIKKLPKSYEATAALIVNSDNTDPLAGRNSVGQNGTFFPTQVELINNGVVLKPVVERLKLASDRTFMGGSPGDAPPLPDTVLAKLRSSVRVQQGAGSQLLYISATARDPVQAANIANAVSDEYLRQSGQRTNAPAIERAARYSEQLAELKEKVDVTQAKVAAFRERNGLADLKDGQAGDLEGSALSDLNGKLLEAQNARRQLESQQNTPEAVSLRGRIDQLEGEMGKASSELGPRHPRILQLQAEIDASRKALSASSATQLARARELELKYQSAFNTERNRLLERRNVQDVGSKLLLEQTLARDAYAQALRGLDQVKFASVGNYKDITVVSRAEPPVKPSKPNKMKMFLAAIVAALGLAVGGPFAYELLLNRKIRCRDDLERGFRIVTLAQFGPMNLARAA